MTSIVDDRKYGVQWMTKRIIEVVAWKKKYKMERKNGENKTKIVDDEKKYKLRNDKDSLNCWMIRKLEG